MCAGDAEHELEGPTPSRAPPRLLVLIDSEPESCAELVSQLECMAWEVRSFRSISEVLEVADLVPRAYFLDESVVHAGSAGELLVRAPSAQLIVMSERPSCLESRLRALRAGATAYVDKPPDINALLARLGDHALESHAGPARVLMVEDDRIVARHVAAVLRHAGIETEVVFDPAALLDTISDFRPDLVLMDMGLPGCTGLELAGVLRQDSRYVGLPIVFLTGDGAQSRRIAAFTQGADDFLTKPPNEERLITTIRSRVERARVLRGYMERDGLTGLFDRAAIDRRLARELEVARRRSAPVSVALIDLDFFKQINDRSGHAFGDSVLRTLSLTLRNFLRVGDSVGRYGGEEFMVVLPDATADYAERVIDRIRDRFESLALGRTSGEFRGATFSAGVASFPTLTSQATLVEAADAALYRAKEGGRNRVEAFRPAGRDDQSLAKRLCPDLRALAPRADDEGHRVR